MGFFGKLFDKKECSICGGEIGLLGNRKLEDGNLCKSCANKLSVWFDDRRHSTVEQIRAQLEYREANRGKVAAFRVTRTLGEGTKLLLDEDAGCFVVTEARDLAVDNPDVLAFSDVTGCILDIDEDRTELMKEDQDGKEISYTPPRYVYEYDFYITIQVRNPYFDEIRFRLNDSTIEIQPSPRGGMGAGRGEMQRMMGHGGMKLPGAMSAGVDPERNSDYRRYKALGEEIKDVLLQARQNIRDEAAAAAAPRTVVTCPYCGATTTPDEAGRCEFCGGAVNG